MTQNTTTPLGARAALSSTRQAVILACVLLTAVPVPAAAQEHEEEAPLFPFAAFLLTGYGAADYTLDLDDGDEIDPDDDSDQEFGALFVPIFLYQMGPDVLFAGEVEFEFEDSEIETEVEYAQIDYLGFRRVILTGGKFLLPFGLFSERYHPAWINELPSLPLLYGHGDIEGIHPLLPILSDLGLLARVSQPIGERWGLDLSFYITQGPRLEGEEEEHAGEADHVDAAGEVEEAFEIPDVTIGDTFDETNDNKLIGARVGIVHAPTFELYLSGFLSKYDSGDILDFHGVNLAPVFQFYPVELRGAGIVLWQEFIDADGIEHTLERAGYYAQASIQLDGFRRYVEPVVRWSYLLEAEEDDVLIEDGQGQLALGVDYWILPSVPVKLAYEFNLDDIDDRLILEWAYGF